MVKVLNNCFEELETDMNLVKESFEMASDKVSNEKSEQQEKISYHDFLKTKVEMARLSVRQGHYVTSETALAKHEARKTVGM